MHYDTDDGGTDVCQTCYHNKYTCTVCRVPHNNKDLSVHRNRELWCKECLSKTDPCNLCREPIRGEYYTLESHEGQWCASCMNGNSKCFFCQKPYQTAGKVLEPGVGICTECSADSFNGIEIYEHLARTIHPQMEALLGKKFKPIAVRIVTPTEMNRIAARFQAKSTDTFLDPISASANPKPSNRRSNLGLFTVENGKREIVVLNNLPDDMAWEVMSHEMAHAWQSEHYPNIPDFYLTEGFAQLVAQKICYQNFRRQNLRVLYYRDDAYGHAYRVVQMLEDREGFGAVMQSLENRQLPEGYRTTPNEKYMNVRVE